MSMLKLRPEVAAFAQLMERKLRDNDHKRHWRKCRRQYLRERLDDELLELDEAPHGGDAYTTECVDIANFAMMLADKNERLKTVVRKRAPRRREPAVADGWMPDGSWKP